MTIIATCGHEIPDNSDEYSIRRKGYDRGGCRVVSHEMACLKCQWNYHHWGELLNSEEEANEWLYGGDYHGEGTA